MHPPGPGWKARPCTLHPRKVAQRLPPLSRELVIAFTLLSCTTPPDRLHGLALRVDDLRLPTCPSRTERRWPQYGGWLPWITVSWGGQRETGNGSRGVVTYASIAKASANVLTSPTVDSRPRDHFIESLMSNPWSWSPGIMDEQEMRRRDLIPNAETVAAMRESEAPETLPDWDDLLGVAPGATGDLSSEAFVRQLRSEWERD